MKDINGSIEVNGRKLEFSIEKAAYYEAKKIGIDILKETLNALTKQIILALEEEIP